MGASGQLSSRKPDRRFILGHGRNQWEGDSSDIPFERRAFTCLILRPFVFELLAYTSTTQNTYAKFLPVIQGPEFFGSPTTASSSQPNKLTRKWFLYLSWFLLWRKEIGIKILELTPGWDSGTGSFSLRVSSADQSVFLTEQGCKCQELTISVFFNLP